LKGNILQLLLAVFVLSFVFYELQERYYQSKITSLKFGKSQIKDFLIVGKNKEKFVLKGDLLEDVKDVVNIKGFVLNYIRNGEILSINSKTAKYLKNADILELEEDVNIRSKDMEITTEALYILIDQKKAVNDTDVKITLKNISVEGKGLVIDFERETLKIDNVKSKIRGI